MKGFVTATSEAAALDFVRERWSTPEFRASAFIADLSKRVAARRPVFYSMSAPAIEWAHFTTWFGAFALREYENKYIQDLYWLHEFTHFVNMKWDGSRGDSFHAWYRRMMENEFEASLESEAIIYLRIPELRAKTFPHPIWIDNRLNKPRRLIGTADVHLAPASIREIWARDGDAWIDQGRATFQRRGWHDVAIDLLRDERMASQRNPDPFDFVEQQMAGYVRQNMAWAQVWARHWRVVEVHMATRAEAGFNDLTTPVHLEWIISKMESTSTLRAIDLYAQDVPFLDEAIAFWKVYDDNKKLYGNHFT